ncbi:MAG: carbamoyltransferase HypF [Bacteroidales bacterium]
MVTGLVQGVGFRPFVYRLAMQYALTGWVQNTNENVRIRISGSPADISLFLEALKEEAPPASMIEAIAVQEIAPEPFTAFTIQHSHNLSDDITEISPDIAVCSDCLEDIEKKGNRLDYAFVNCTNCGPRFTIIQDLPYDRAGTTMQTFEMCPDCRREYGDILDRRFHAQPTACKRCGPQYELFIKGRRITGEINEIVVRTSDLLANGGILLIKGLGGMHLACDAFSEAAVEKLRNIKKRDGKAFAVMFRNMESLKRYALVTPEEEQSLTSWRRPIVLLAGKNGSGKHGLFQSEPPPGAEDQDSTPLLAPTLNARLNLLGVMLPYMPFHYLLFKHLKTDAIVLTSGNFSSEPILIDNGQALEQFSACTDAIVLHNRDIFNRTDDSVVRLMDGRERLLRRSRGYVPAPVRTTHHTDGILAFGAELTNCFCVGKGQKAFLSQHIGDLQGLETTAFYEQTISRFLKLFRVKPSLLAVDMHPDYISTRTAENFPGIPLVAVQHHHAHIASCMAEHHLDEQVIGIALDGTGYGDDGHTWGSEFLLCDLRDYTRVTHFEYLPLPGGDLATEEPWRMAVTALYKTYGKEFIHLKLDLFEKIEPEKIALLTHMIDRNIHCPLTCGAGRLFDAVASLLGLCHVATFQAEGPMRLEALVLDSCNESYPFETAGTIRFEATIRGIVNDLLDGVSKKIIAAKFHNTLISVIFEGANSIRLSTGTDKVVLSGGVFQNRYLLEGAIARLTANDFKVYTHAAVPTNDGGIALGQLVIASKRRNQPCV